MIVLVLLNCGVVSPVKNDDGEIPKKILTVVLGVVE